MLSNTRTLSRPKTAAIATLGCKANQYDSSAIEDMLLAGGFLVVDFSGPADAYIINTCTVTGGTNSQSRAVIRKARKMNPDAVVIVTGCYAQMSPDEVKNIDGVDYILGNPEKDRVLECLEKGKGRQYASPAPLAGAKDFGAPLTLRAFSSGGRARVNLKVQDGCDRACSYCIIPKARGRSRSLPIETLEKEVALLVQKGYKEIILTGIHLGAYGKDLPKASSVCEVIRMVRRFDNACRFRISSLDPDEVTGEFIGLLASSKNICNHMHLPLQSGDDTVLGKMRRAYTKDLFADRVQKLAALVKDISIGVDVIAGFPGEGEREFENTYSLLEALPVSYIHSFPYSKRDGTVAVSLPGQVQLAVIKERCMRLKVLDAHKRLAFYRRFEGAIAEAVFEASADAKTGLFKGKTKNYMPVFVATPFAAKKLLTVRLGRATAEGFAGTIYLTDGQIKNN
ncbi:tRNA (N(6)-L-threonylcarbamoyladenosine(37)-C(2))-methylthiotransferase MtaB [bacterium]|nr:MAG: tRNA (N(6)-L-threonylcarbamoyladenosine(37)-C(2))-methylthiotransferase MtaB [bacterium]